MQPKKGLHTSAFRALDGKAQQRARLFGGLAGLARFGHFPFTDSDRRETPRQLSLRSSLEQLAAANSLDIQMKPARTYVVHVRGTEHQTRSAEFSYVVVRNMMSLYSVRRTRSIQSTGELNTIASQRVLRQA